MRALTGCLLGWLAALLVLSCASTKPALAPASGQADSLVTLAKMEDAMAGDLFVERHAAFLDTLDAKERAGFGPRLVEARSLVAAAEEMYLRGRTVLALDLLDDAETLLRKGN
jgi:hypothetical protein